MSIKEVKIKKVFLLRPIKVPGRFRDHSRSLLDEDMLDKLELLNQSWLYVENEGNSILIPTTNISYIEIMFPNADG